MKPLSSGTRPIDLTQQAPRGADTWCFRLGAAIDIKFGMPKYNCRFHGICEIEVGNSKLPQLPRGHGKGWLFIPRAGYCLICFDKRSLPGSTEAVQFDRKHFELLEAVPFSEKLGRLVGRIYCLQPGQYRIQDKEQVYTVLFRI